MLWHKVQGAGGVVQPASFSFSDVVSDPANSSTYTFTNVDIGEAAANRTLVLPVYALAGNGEVSSVEVNSNSATLLAGPVVNTSQGKTYLYAIDLAASSTATIVVTLNADVFRLAVGVYSLYGFNSTPSSISENDLLTGTNETTAVTTAISPSSGDAIICCGEVNTSPGVTGVTWSSSYGSLTEDYDFNPENRFVSAASMVSPSSGSLTISIAPTSAGTTIRELIAASFSPA